MRDPLIIKMLFAVVAAVWLIASISMLRAKALLNSAARHLDAPSRLHYKMHAQLDPSAPHVRALLHGQGEAAHDAALPHLKRARIFGRIFFVFAAIVFAGLFMM